jgi:ABC-type multidrug transport system fused ATPase/permease subunit
MFCVLKKCCNILDKDQKKKLFGLIILMIIGAGTEALSVSLIIPYITSVVSSKPSVMITLALIVAFAIKNVYLYYLKCVQNNFIVKNCYKASVKLFKAYLNKPYEFFLYNNSNTIVTTINVYVTKAFVLINEFLNLVTEVIIDIFLISILMFVNFKVTLAMFFILAVLLLIIKIFISPRLREVGKKSNDAYVGMITCVSQAINGIKEVKMFEGEEFFISEYEKLGSSNVSLENKKNKYSFFPRHLTEFVAVSAALTFILISSSYFQYDTSQAISLTALFSFVLLRMLPGVIKINGHMNQISYYTPSLLAIDEEVSSYMKNSNDETNNPIEQWRFEKSISVCDVSFSYDHSRGNCVLKGASIEIAKGECIGIVGASGIGKTTLVDIILGYLKPDEGVILADGTEINHNLKGWRKNIGYVPQMIFLMDDTIRNNVVFGAKACVDEKIWELLRRVKMDEVVSSLPDGLDTYVGERGIRLSGGQRQRLGIARALFHNPDILVLDEATASLDNKLEAEIMEDIYSLNGKKTVIVIAHRLTSLKKCNKIYKIEDGRLVRTEI